MTDEETHWRRRTLPLDRYLDPALSYTIDENRAVLVAANDSFTDSFGEFSSRTSLSTVFDGIELDVHDCAIAFPDCLHTDDGCTLSVDPTDSTSENGRYLARVSPPTDGSLGYVVFVETADERSALEVDRVASVISHDLRNPLDVAKARLRAGRETGNDEHFDHVAQAHDRMERIIKDVLTLARSEDVIEPTSTIDLETAAETAWETVKTGDAELTFDDTLPTIVADRDRVERLFENVFRNAVEHGSTSHAEPDGSADAVEHGSTSHRSQPPEDAVEHGSTSPRSQAHEDAVEHGRDCPHVTVGTVSSDGFYVADDGPGIAEEHREAVFEPGFTAGDDGTGLGLAIVERIATAHDWSVTVTTADDGGARFEIRGIETAKEGTTSA